MYPSLLPVFPRRNPIHPPSFVPLTGGSERAWHQMVAQRTLSTDRPDSTAVQVLTVHLSPNWDRYTQSCLLLTVLLLSASKAACTWGRQGEWMDTWESGNQCSPHDISACSRSSSSPVILTVEGNRHGFWLSAWRFSDDATFSFLSNKNVNC